MHPFSTLDVFSMASFSPSAEDELAPTRLSLLERLRNLDDHGSWQEFFDTYWRLLYLAASRAGLSDADAEDVVQETVIGIARHMESFRYEPEVCSFKGWLMTITRHRIADHQRKARQAQRGQQPLPENAESLEDAAAKVVADKDFENVWDEEWHKNLLEAAMERVKRRVAPIYYQIFYLHSVRGMPAREVGKLLGTSVPRVYVVRHRVARMIKSEARQLERRGPNFCEPPVPLKPRLAPAAPCD